MTYCGQFWGPSLLLQEGYGERGEMPADGDEKGQTRVPDPQGGMNRVGLTYLGEEELEEGSNSSCSYLKAVTKRVESKFSVELCNITRGNRQKLLIR